MKFAISIIFILLIILLCTQCNSDITEPDNCGINADMIEFNEDSFNAFPPAFLDKKEFIFLDSLHRERKFIGEFKREILLSPNSIYCQQNDQLINLYEYERYIGKFIDNDSMKIILTLSITGDDCVYPFSQDKITDDILYIACFYSISPQNSQFILGSFSNIISNYIDDHPISSCQEKFRNVNEIKLGGQSFENLWSSSEVSQANNDIYFKYGKGIVGLIDTFGISWRLK